uniref:GntR family transcriptional regulator n=1 Tax=Thermorudis sp. TaxID=1969470 RepID=A0A7C3APB4_9BACT
MRTRSTTKTSKKELPTDKNGLLADTAYALIKRSIIRCDLEPGQPITEEQLGTRFGIGRAAARAAIKRLHQEQFIHRITRNRYVVAPITLKHVNELFELRLLLEPAAARLAAGKLDPETQRRLQELARARYQVGDRKSAEAFLRTNTEFHALIAQASGNSLLASVIRGMLDKVERVHHMSHLLRDRSAEAIHEHQELLDALVAGDADRAEQVMIQQILAAKQFVIEAMLASSSLQTVNVALSSSRPEPAE